MSSIVNQKIKEILHLLGDPVEVGPGRFLVNYMNREVKFTIVTLENIKYQLREHNAPSWMAEEIYKELGGHDTVEIGFKYLGKEDDYIPQKMRKGSRQFLLDLAEVAREIRDHTNLTISFYGADARRSKLWNKLATKLGFKAAGQSTLKGKLKDKIYYHWENVDYIASLISEDLI